MSVFINDAPMRGFRCDPEEVRKYHQDNQRVGATRKADSVKCWDELCRLRFECKRTPRGSERIKLGDISERPEPTVDPYDLQTMGMAARTIAYCPHFL
jgi:hypothetical protein